MSQWVLDRSHITSPDWAVMGACVGYPTEWFYPEKGSSARQAMRLCFECPVRRQCLEHALGFAGRPYERDGVWGGSAASQRPKLRKVSLDDAMDLTLARAQRLGLDRRSA